MVLTEQLKIPVNYRDFVSYLCLCGLRQITLQIFNLFISKMAIITLLKEFGCLQRLH
jgi:hypothetical protein